MRFLKLQVLLLVIAVLVVAALGADLVLKGRAEDQLATEVATRVPGTTGVKAKISSFPFVGRLLVSGKVSQVVVTVQHAGVGELGLSDIRVAVDDVEMDSRAARQGRAVVRSIGKGSVQADLRQDQINPRLPKGVQVQLEAGKAVVTGPASAAAQLVATPEGSIQLKAANRVVFDLPLPKTDLLPCAPRVTYISGAARLTCTFDKVPPLLLNLARR